MSEYQIVNERRFPLKVKSMNDNVDLLPYHRWEHRVTVGRNGKRYMVFLDNLGIGDGPKLYIEEITNGHAERIEDESLFQSIFRWVTAKGFVSVQPPLFKAVGYEGKDKNKYMHKEIKV